MNVQCPQCNQTTELSFSTPWKYFGCPKCHTLFQKMEDGAIQQSRILPKNPLALHLYIGQQGVFEGKLWEVVNATIKYPTSEPYGWQEFTLRNKDGEECFLSEYNGHWTLATEVSDPALLHDIKGEYSLHHGEETYKLFHSTAYKTEYLSGFFNSFLPSTGLAKDYVSPPKAVLLERDDSDPRTYTFEARYVPDKEIREAFPTLKPPRAQGVGMLQPFSTNLVNFGYIIGGFGLIMILYQFLFTLQYPNYEVLREYVMLPDSVAEVSHVSPSFQVTGAKGPLQIDLSAPVDNSWAAVDFTLVNEDTRKEQYGSVEIAYYHGVDGGESWSEGSKNPSIKICGVEPGRYHLAMQVAKQPLTPDINSLKYTVTARSSTIWNLVLCLGLLLGGFLGVLIWRSSFEHQRWMLSDFPPQAE
ncbi:MAG: hypothetical protein IT261_00295 [Saprospiraceae bacterium]|nr:hypothetical protein [Saprospiraceae bacterium]